MISEARLRPDIPFWTWVIARRIPIFALIATLVMTAGASLISRHVQTYMSTADVLLDPRLARDHDLDSETHFDVLKFRVLTSGEIEQAIAELSLTNDPISRIQLRHDPAASKITLGFRDPDPEAALLMTRAIATGFMRSAQAMSRQDANRRIEQYEAETNALREDLARLDRANDSVKTDVERRLTEELYQDTIAKLAAAKADFQSQSSDVVSLSRAPSLAQEPYSPNKSTMYLALASFAIFCGLVVILILEWLDTVIRRPHDIETSLGLATFGVIPDLQLQPIEPTPHSKRGI